MKKFFYFAAAAVMMLTAACQREMLESPLQGDTKVTFTVSPAEAATKADIADGTNVNILYWEIYGADLTKEPLGEGYVDTKADEKSFIVPLSLVADQEYNIIFWAEVKDAGHYKTDDLRKVEIVDYTNEKANDETRAAFFRLYNFSTENGGVIEEDVYLYRPFSQLNLGATTLETSLNLVNEGKVEVVSTSVTVTNIANVFNTVKGEGEGAASVIFAHAETPVDYTKKLLEVGDDTYHWLGMNYLIVQGNSDNVTVDIEVKTTVGTVNHKVSNVPVKENYRTNLIGDLLTTGATFKVIVDERFVNPETGELNPDLPESSLDQLMLAAQLGGKVTLKEDVVLNTPLVVDSGAEFELNLNGKTIKYDPTATRATTADYLIYNYGRLSVVGEGKLLNELGYVIENEGTLSIEAAEVNGLGGIRSKAGKVTLNGGTYTAASDWSKGTYNHVFKAERTVGVINGGKFDATIGGTNNAMINVSTESVVTINGGDFVNVDTAEPIAEFAPYMFTYENDGKLVINYGSFYGGWRFNGTTASTDIYGGEFSVSYDGQSFHASSTHVLKVYGGTFSLANGAILDPKKYVAEGYVVKDNANGTWTVLPDVEGVEDMVLHEESGLFYNGNNANHKSVYYLMTSHDLKTATEYFTGQAHSNEANVVTFELYQDLDLAGIDWTPWSVMFITVNANGHTISNVSNSFFGYAGAVKVNDLTLENVTASGNQAGTFAASVEGGAFTNCYLKGTNTVTYVDAGKDENGVGAICGVSISANTNVTIVEGATVAVDMNTIENTAKTTFADILNGYKHTVYAVNKGKIVNNGSVTVSAAAPIVADAEGTGYSGELFEPGATDFFVLQGSTLTGDATITVKRTYNTVALEGVTAEVNGDLIVAEAYNTIILHDCDITLAEGKKLITTANGATVGQVMIHNVKVNGVLLTSATAGDYMQGVNWFEVW